jgi:hypothetical protein
VVRIISGDMAAQKSAAGYLIQPGWFLRHHM